MPSPSQLIVAQLAAQYGSFDPTKQQLLRKLYYDYVRYPGNGTQALTLFTVPIGGADPVSGLQKTAEQTNLTRPGQFENVSYLIYRVQTHIFLLPKARQPGAVSSQLYLVNGQWAATQSALEDLADQGILNINIGQKAYFDFDLPFRSCPPGMGLQITQVGAANALTTGFPPLNVWMQQSPRLMDIMQLAPPQMIENQQTFNVQITFPRGLSPTIPTVNGAQSSVDIGVLFDGYVIQPVQ